MVEQIDNKCAAGESTFRILCILEVIPVRNWTENKRWRD